MIVPLRPSSVCRLRLDALTSRFIAGICVMSDPLPPEQDRPGVPLPPPLLFILPVLCSLVIEHIRPTDFVHGGFRFVGGSVALLSGIALTATGFRTQKRAGTDPIPFNPSTVIVTHGLYRFSRNPMYVGFALATFGVAVLANSLWTLLAVPISLILVDRLIITKEEAYLARKFGEEYLRYKASVRRWL
jgi:protein-S-isoprenylcysteine O-methyltransferase Ste14